VTASPPHFTIYPLHMFRPHTLMAGCYSRNERVVRLQDALKSAVVREALFPDTS